MCVPIISLRAKNFNVGSLKNNCQNSHCIIAKGILDPKKFPLQITTLLVVRKTKMTMTSGEKTGFWGKIMLFCSPYCDEKFRR